MKVSFGVGVVFLPFAFVASTQYFVAKSCGDRLSDVVASVMGPLLLGSSDLASQQDAEAPVAALSVPEDVDFGSGDKADKTANIAPSRGITQRKSPGNSSARSAPSLSEKALPPLYVAAPTVLRIANSGHRPSGRAVTAHGRRPAGVQVFGASALGIGVRDGDIITKVNGVPVTSANQVIALVIAARGARQTAISALMYRGQRSYVLTVEQPYMPGVVQTPHAAAQAPAGPPDSERSTDG